MQTTGSGGSRPEAAFIVPADARPGSGRSPPMSRQGIKVEGSTPGDRDAWESGTYLLATRSAFSGGVTDESIPVEDGKFSRAWWF